MSTFRKMFAGLRAEVRSSRHQSVFAGARERRVALAAHPTVAAVLAALADQERAYADKEAITRALIAEQQANPSEFWAAVLLVAYYPLLSRLRRRIYGDALPGEDLDQLVVTRFLSVVAEHPLDAECDRTAMRLRQKTEREVFRVVRAEQTDQKRLYPTTEAEIEKLAETTWPAPKTKALPPRNAKDIAGAVALLVEHASAALDGETFDMLAATLIARRKIPAYLEALHPGMTAAERKRIYPRMKRRHSRALERIRPAMVHLACPRPGDDRLCLDRDREEDAER